MEEGIKEEEENPQFDSIIKFAQTTHSQEAKFRVCPMTRDSGIFPDSISSSPDPTPSEPTEIVMVSLPDSSEEAGAAEEDDAVYHTPPEHHLRSSSSEEQNFVDCADLKKVRVSDRGLDDECQSERVRVTEEEEESGEEMVRVGEDERNVDLMDTEVIVLDGSDSGEEAINLGVDSVDVDRVDGELARALGGEGGELAKISVTENCDSRKVSEVKEGVEANAGSGCDETREESVVARAEEVVKAIEDVKMSGDGATGGGSLRTGFKSIDENDKFRYVCGEDGETRGKLRIGGDGDDGARKRRQLPVTIKGKEKVMGERDEVPVPNKGKEKVVEERDEVPVLNKGKEKVVEERDEVHVRSKGKDKVVGERDEVPVVTNGKEKDELERDEVQEKKEKLKAGLLKMLDVLEIVVGKKEGEPEDFLEVAKRRGMKFPHPIWWPKEGEDW